MWQDTHRQPAPLGEDSRESSCPSVTEWDRTFSGRAEEYYSLLLSQKENGTKTVPRMGPFKKVQICIFEELICTL